MRRGSRAAATPTTPAPQAGPTEAEVAELKESIAAAEEATAAVREELFVAQARIKDLEGATWRSRIAAGETLEAVAGVTVTPEILAEVQRNIKEQEALISGYQTENERLTAAVKSAQSADVDTQHAMFLQNQALTARVTELQSALDAATAAVRPRPSDEAAKAAAALTAARESELREQLEAVQDELDAAIEARKAAAKSHAQDVTQLKERIAWYAENQERLDAKTDEINKLKAQLKEQVAAPSQVAESARIAELERALKDALEENRPGARRSIDNLVRAARPTLAESKALAEAVGRVAELESELESQREDADNKLRGLRQEAEKVRVGYEKRLAAMNSELALRPRPTDKPHVRIQQLETQLATQKRKYEKELLTARAAIQPHPEPLSPPSSSSRPNQPSPSKLLAKISRLEAQLTAKDQALASAQQELSERPDVEPASTPVPALQLPPASAPENDSALRQELRRMQMALQVAEVAKEITEENLRALLRQQQQHQQDQDRERESAPTPAPAPAPVQRSQPLAPPEAPPVNMEMALALERTRGELQAAQTAVATAMEQARLARSERDDARARVASLEAELVRVQRPPETRQYDSLRAHVEDLEARYARREREVDELLVEARGIASAEVAAAQRRMQAMEAAQNERIAAYKTELNDIIAGVMQLKGGAVVAPPPVSSGAPSRGLVGALSFENSVGGRVMR